MSARSAPAHAGHATEQFRGTTLILRCTHRYAGPKVRVLNEQVNLGREWFCRGPADPTFGVGSSSSSSCVAGACLHCGLLLLRLFADHPPIRRTATSSKSHYHPLSPNPPTSPVLALVVPRIFLLQPPPYTHLLIDFSRGLDPPKDFQETQCMTGGFGQL